MANIILAYIIGVLCGVGYMYLRYSKRIREQQREIDKLARTSVWMNGRLDALYTMNGMTLNTYAGDESGD